MSGYTACECLHCTHRIDNEDNTFFCELYPEDGNMTEETAPKYTFESFRGTGFPDYLCTDCEDVDWEKVNDDY